MKPSTRACLLLALTACGCRAGGPDIVVAPRAEIDLAAIGEGTAIDLRLSERPDEKLRMSERGEVVASGEKGKVFLEGARYEEYLRRGLTEAFRKAGFTVQEGAPIRVDVTLTEFLATASQFTEWPYDEDYQIFLLEPLIRLFLPGSTQTTAARTTVSVKIAKDGKLLFASEPMQPLVRKESRDPDVVEEVLSELHEATIENVVSYAAPNVKVAEKVPVADAEFKRREEALLALEKEIDRRASELSARRKALDEGEQVLAEQQATLQREERSIAEREEKIRVSSEAMRKLEAELRAARESGLEDEVERLQGRIASQEREVARLREERDRSALAKEDLERQLGNLAARQAALREHQTDLQKINRQLEEELASLRGSLARQEKVQNNLRAGQRPPEADLKALAAGPRPLVLLESPGASSLTTAERWAEVSGVVVSLRDIRACELKVNDQDPVEACNQAAEGEEPCKHADGYHVCRFQRTVDLNEGPNRILVTARASDASEKTIALDILREERSKRGQVHLLAIGIEEYETGTSALADELRGEAGFRIPNLRFAVEDARAAATALQEALGVPDSHVTILENAQATRYNILDQFGKRFQLTSPDDVLVVYFAGHGAPGRAAGGIAKFLLPYDARPNLELSAVSADEIAARLQVLNNRVLFIADTCYSGAIADGVRTADLGINLRESRGHTVRPLDETLKGPGRVILTAARAEELAREKEELGHGVFTYYLVRGLEGEADRDGDRSVTLTELYDYVSRSVRQATNGQQNPQINPDDLARLDDLITFRVPADG